MSPEQEPQKPVSRRFDPFAVEPHAGQGSRSWFWAMTIQALCTCALLGLLACAEGKRWEIHARFIVLIGVVGTWSLALRTIRERLLELMRHWQRASRGLLRKASESGRHLLPVPLHSTQDQYIKACIWRLRIIAAGITIPFFVMPFVWSFISVVLALTVEPLTQDYWEGVALFMMVSAFVVAGYFHWAILPLPARVRTNGARRWSRRSV
ncbi:MAG: hypothetical protein ABSE73_25435 [Planctomycetota bacterium]